jgi:hypothetical protein
MAAGLTTSNRPLAEHFTFGFRVEEFAQPHFDATLHAA